MKAASVRRAIVAIFTVLVASQLTAVSGERSFGLAPTYAQTEEYSVQTSLRPNIILFLTDDQAEEEMRFLPNTERLLMEEGTYFENAFLTQSLCCPSRASILTGKYPHNHGIFGNTPPSGGFRTVRERGLEEKTVARELDEAGYRTGLFGKYFNGYNGHVPAPYWDVWGAYPGPYFRDPTNQPSVHLPRSDDATDVMTAHALDFIDQSVEEPMFLYLSYLYPHRPAHYPSRYADLYPRQKVPRTPNFNEADVRDKPKYIQEDPRLSKKKVASLDAFYRDRARSLRAIDDSVADVVAELEALGELDNTYLILMSDNGYHMGHHRQDRGKQLAYEEDISTPLVVRGPSVPHGVRREEIVLNTDIAPTIAAWTGTSLPTMADGHSFAELVDSDGVTVKPWRKRFLVERRRGGAGLPSYHAVRTQQTIYSRLGTGEQEFYNLTEDPYQLQNRADTIATDVLERHRGFLRNLKACDGAECTAAEGF
jgi:N-acetylglucosamine-6-sulfatase